MPDFSLKVKGLLGGSLPWSFGFFAAGSGSEASTSSTFNTAVGTLFTTATNGIQNFITSDVTVTGTVTSTLNGTMHQVTETIGSLSITGTATGNSLPWSVAEVVTTITGFAQKSGHGRIFLPPFAESTVASHVITSGTITSLKTVFDTFFSTIITAGIQPFIFNRKPLKDGTPAITQKPLNAPYFKISNKPAQQRRRVSKVVPTYTSG